MNLASYIYSFLKDKRGQVEVPNFGVFSIRKESAIVDEKSSKIFPPREIISFEKIKEVNGEDLLMFISNKEGKEVSIIQKFVQDEVDKWIKELSMNGKLDLAGIGTIEVSGDGEVLLVQKSISDSMEYFGLEEISLKEIELPNKENNFKRAFFWIFLAMVFILILAFLGLQYRDLLFNMFFENIYD